MAGIGTALVFLGGLLAHELAHAVVATREGLPVDGITLWLLGGVASLRGEAQNPAAEVRVASAGPLASVGLALLFGVLAALLTLTGADGLMVGAAAWLSGINLALALFNILPAAPLDGGRLLRAALWRWRGDRRWAAIVSARAGRVLGGALLTVGLWQLLFTVNGIGGLWLALLGGFLIGAATVEEREVVIGEALAGLRVWQIMSPYPATAPPDINVADFLDQYLFRHRFSSFPLVSEERPVGLVTLNQIKAVPADQRDRIQLHDIAWDMSDVPVAAPDSPLSELLAELGRRADGRALVVSDGELVGIVTPSDIARAIEYANLFGGQHPSDGDRR